MKKITCIFCFLCIMFLNQSCKKQSKQESKQEPQVSLANPQESNPQPQPAKKVLLSQIGGKWYTNVANELLTEVKKYMERATPENPEKEGKEIFALISPHAGYIYSGLTAAHGYKLLAGKSFKRVVVIALSHRGFFQGIALPSATHLATPIGEIPIDDEERTRLLKYGIFSIKDDAFIGEHSLEIQLPFLQAQLKDFSILPILVGRLSFDQIKVAALALMPLMKKDTLFVISSDFTHYGPNYEYMPFKDNVEENLKKLDMGAFEKIKAIDVEDFIKYREETQDTICGHHPVEILLAMLKDYKDEISVELVKYDTSGKITGDFTNSVSYFSIAFLKKWGPILFKGVKFIEPEEEKILLELARLTLRKHLAKQPLPDPDKDGIKLTNRLKENFGVFVTLKEHGELMGCIGTIMPVEPLFEGVIKNTVNAAANDTRFNPVMPEEEKLIEIEISVLSKPEFAKGGYGDIVLGRHGIILNKSGHSAVFLPQVAPEQGWNLDQTLSHLSRKAGLPDDAWKQGAHFSLFIAHVFGEK